MAANVVGDEFRILCQSYTYHELVGAHTGTISGRRLWLYRIDLMNRSRFNGKSWTVRQLNPPARIESMLDEARLVADSPLVLAEYYLWNESQYQVQGWDTDANRPAGRLLRIPGSSEFYNATPFFSPSTLCVYTASNRRLVLQDQTATWALDTVGGQRIHPDGLADMINRCAAISRPMREQVDPVITDDLRFLLVVPPHLSAPDAHEQFSLDGVAYSFKEFGYYAESGSPTLRPFSIQEGHKGFGGAASDAGRLLLLYGDDTGLLLRSADGSFEAQTAAPSQVLTTFKYNRPGFIPQTIFWNTARGQVVVWSMGEQVLVWDYKTGQARLLPDPTAGKPRR
jgi:hypothetical protein